MVVSLRTAVAERLLSQGLQPWPIVERFLLDQPSGAVGLDIGCGNGKYLSVNPNVFILASDRFVIPCAV